MADHYEYFEKSTGAGKAGRAGAEKSIYQSGDIRRPDATGGPHGTADTVSYGSGKRRYRHDHRRPVQRIGGCPQSRQSDVLQTRYHSRTAGTDVEHSRPWRQGLRSTHALRVLQAEQADPKKARADLLLPLQRTGRALRAPLRLRNDEGGYRRCDSRSCANGG